MLLNLFLGIAASLVVWLLLTKVLRPHLTLDERLQKLIRKDGTVAYRVECRPGIRRIEDVNVTVRLVLRTSPQAARGRWAPTYIPVGEPFRPVLDKGSFLWRFLRTEKRLIRYPVLQLAKVDCGSLQGHLLANFPPIADFREFLIGTRTRQEARTRSGKG